MSAPAPTTSSVRGALSSAITSTGAANDSSTVTLFLTYTGTHQFYRVYLDTDRSPATGFGYAGIGAELLIENANLYRYTGSGSNWAWTPVGPVTFSRSGGQATWIVTRSAIGETDPCNAAADLIFDVDDGTAPEVHETLTPAPTCGGAGASSGGTAALSVTDAGGTNDATDAQYTFAYAGSPAFWRVYVDTDNSASTGFMAAPGVGADVLLEGNGVYRYVGPGWSWTPLGSATFSSASGIASWSVTRALIGETAACGETSTLLFQVQDAEGNITSTGAVNQTFTNAGSCSSSGSGGGPAMGGAGGSSAPPPATGGTGGMPSSGSGGASGGTGGGTGGNNAAGGHTNVVFVIAMENEAAGSVYGSSSAPYLNGQLIPHYAHATAFTDPLPDAIPSEPHYVWLEAGTNAFADATFTTDADPDAGNSTVSSAHLTAQMNAASPAVSWLAFEEGLDPSTTGACPISSAGFYAAKHDPFVFFQDIVGRTPSQTASLCVAHHRAYTPSSFAQALSQGAIAQYNFITPNLCNDMHGASGCPGPSDVIAAGDSWLSANLPPLIQYANANNGVIFLIWDEPEGGSPLIPFVAIGPHIKAGYASSVPVTHSALVKTVEKIFGLPILSAVASANDFGDVFQAGSYP